MNAHDYWLECLQQSAEEHGVSMTPEQAEAIANDIQGGHENYGMAFYSPPSSDRLNQVEREWKSRYDKLQAKLDAYRRNAETAVKRALRQPHDANVSIGEYGEVERYDGRFTKIQ